MPAKKTGRPPKKKKDLRTERLFVYVSPTEHATIARAAKKDERSTADFVRRTCIAHANFVLRPSW